MATDSSNPILLYDGVCGLCHRLVQFSLKRDRRGRLRFASLQSNLAAEILRRHGLDPRDLDTVYLVEACGQAEERLLPRSDAIISLLRQIGGPWPALAAVLRIIPKFLLEWVYRRVARNRYRIFGSSDTCLLPDAEFRDRFLDL
jgi:predicted DCC family thiol-disulfide oxidoreductase YuxK